MLRDHLKAGGTLLGEGAHGAMLDVSAGTYPFVTSSHCTSAAFAAGLQVSPRALDATLVVLKAYTTRVGGGPFPTELSDATGEYLRARGNEYGTSTGRPRRTGWFDAVVARTAVELSGCDAVALTKLDVLDDLEEISVCVGYRLDGRDVETFRRSSRTSPGSSRGTRSARGGRRRRPASRDTRSCPRRRATTFGSSRSMSAPRGLHLHRPAARGDDLAGRVGVLEVSPARIVPLNSFRLAASLLWRPVDRRGVEPLEARRPSSRKEQVMGLILLILLVLVLLGALPAWPYSRGWGYRPTGIVGVILVIVVVLLLTGRL